MYTSTRSKMKVTSSNAIINGIASDGGLFYPESISKVDLNNLLEKNYKEIANVILKEFLDDFDEKDIKDIIDRAYDEKFDTPNVVEIKKCSDAYFLELFHGPTLAFKDVALSILPLLMEKSKEMNNVKENTVILTATSGDTGSAALSGFYHSNNTSMVVFYPTDGISKIQENQMLSFRNDLLHPIALKGNFDDAQSFVKEVFNNQEMIKYLKEKNIILSSANSINIGRLIPQVVYYFYSYIDLYKIGEIKLFEKVNFVVPTGNFGNILAAYIAKEMGLPINKLICASNENNVLTNFFNEKVYDKNRPFFKTLSPSMDILISSNLDRLLYSIYRDERVVCSLMKDLKEKGSYKLPNDNNALDIFYADFATEQETLEAIKAVYEKDQYLIDTHTAVAYSVYEKYVKKTNDNTKTVIASTASPLKFPKAVCKALCMDYTKDEFDLINDLTNKAQLNTSSIAKLNKEFKKVVWEKEQAYKQLKELL